MCGWLGVWCVCVCPGDVVAMPYDGAGVPDVMVQLMWCCIGLLYGIAKGSCMGLHRAAALLQSLLQAYYNPYYNHITILNATPITIPLQSL